MASNSTATPSSEPSATPTPTPTPSPSVTEPSSSAAPPSSDQPSSTPVSIPPSSSPPPASSAAPSSNPAPPSSTVVVTASSIPPSTQIITSYVTPSATVPGETPTPSIIVVTIVSSAPNGAQSTNGSPAQSTVSSTGTAGATLQQPEGKEKSGGLGTGGKTAIAVVVPVVTIAIIAIAGLLLWKRRKQKKTAEEARRKEVEEYGFNPNNDPTLPAVGMQSEMAEDQSGYRGWGNTTNSSNRKGSTTLGSGGMAYSDSNSNPGGYQSPGSPTQGTYSDGHSADPLVKGRRETMDSDGIGALGAAPVANQTQNGVHRGPSNASSSYSAADRSDNSGDYPIPVNNPQEYYDNSAYYQPGPYDANAYGGGQQPVIRDVSARRNTRIENPSVFPQQGNSGISQNF